MTSAGSATTSAIDVGSIDGVNLPSVTRAFPRKSRRRRMLRHLRRQDRLLLLLLLMTRLRQIPASFRQFDGDLELMLSSDDASEAARVEQRKPGLSDDGIGAFQRHGFLLALAADVVKGEEQMVLVMKIGGKADLDLVVEFGRVIVVKDVGRGGSDEGAIRRRRGVIEGRTGPSVDAAQWQGARFVGIADLTSDCYVARSRKRLLDVVFEFARIDVDVILIGGKRSHEVEE